MFVQKVRQITFSYNRTPNAYVRTYGCQQNFADSEKIRGMMKDMGYNIIDNDDEADIIIFNTCAVRENAEDRVFGNVGALKHKKSKNPGLKILLCGCMVQQRQVSERLSKTFPFIDLIFGTHLVHTLPSLLYNLLSEGGKGIKINESEYSVAENMPVVRDSKYKANISIMYGCDNFCTYCIVPYVRGRERSRNANRIVEEIKLYYDDGCREFLLLGQNVNSYGKGSDVNFPELLRRIDRLEGEFIVNYMTSHPKDCTRELIDTVAASKKISHHLHLPVQSGSDRVLKMMNRGYTKEQYLSLVKYAKQQIPDISVTTDIIVGFPGETYDDFKETLSLLREAQFDSAYTFIYSKRSSTAAAGFEDPVSGEEKGEWFRELLTVQCEIGENSYHKYLGQTLRVFCTGKGRSDENLLTGKSRQGIIVDFPGNKDNIGTFVDIEVTKALNWALIGKIV